jgi:hypothetical protein
MSFSRPSTRLSLYLACLVAAVTLPASIASAQTLFVIPFEGGPGMPNSPGNTTVPVECRISNQFAFVGVLFSSGAGADYIAAVDLGTNHATSGTIGVGGATLTNTLTYSGSPLLLARFVDPLNPGNPFVTNLVSVRGDLQSAGATISMRAFNVANVLIGSVSAPDEGGTLLSINATGIHRVEIDGTGTVAYDDFSFHAPSAPSASAAAPEPASLAMLALSAIGGLPLVGAVVRRRRRSAT